MDAPTMQTVHKVCDEETTPGFNLTTLSCGFIGLAYLQALAHKSWRARAEPHGYSEPVLHIITI